MRYLFLLLAFVSFCTLSQDLDNESAKYRHNLMQQKTVRSKEIVYTKQIQENDIKQFQLNNISKYLKNNNQNTMFSTLTVGTGCTYLTLQAAVDAASSGDIIRVRDTTFSNSTATVNISDKSLIINGGYGFGCNTLSGNRTTLDGAGQADSLLEFADSSGGMTAFLSNFYIKNGEDDTDYGGGIEISGHSSNPLSITLSNVKITNSQSARGGAIHLSFADLFLVSGTRIYSNTAIIDGTDTGHGGGIYCVNSSIDMQQADIGFAFGNSAQANGGGVYLDNCDLVLNAISGTVTPIIRLNSAADGSGGGVYATNASRIDLHGDKASISANNSKWGGGVSLHAATKLWGDNGKINNNTASLSGGGFSLDGAGTVFDMDRYNNYPCLGKCSELSNNHAFRGGAGSIGASSEAYIESSWIEGNTANDSSVVFSNAGILSLKNSMLLHNQAIGPVSQLVLTIGEFASTIVEQSTIADSHLFPETSSLFDVTISSQASLTLDSNIIWENDNTSLYSIDNSQTVVVENNILQFNHGGSNLQSDPLFLVPGSNYHISPLSPAVDFANASFDPNVSDIDAENRDYGALPDAGADEAYLRIGVADSGCAYTSITEAIAAASDGDFLYISPGNYVENPGLIEKSLTLTPSTEFCNAEEQLASSDTIIIDGGDLFRTKGGLFEINNSSSVVFKYMTLRDAQANNGGIIHISDHSTLQLVDVYMRGGMASQTGGGIFSDGSHVIMYDTQVTANTATINAGGVYIREANLEMYESSTIGGGNGNTASSSGGGLYIESSTVNIAENSSITDNQANFGGGINVFSLGQNSNIISGEIKNNTATSDGGGIYVWSASAANVDLDGVNINNNDAQNGAGIFYNTNTFGGQLTASLSTISNNNAAIDGGGIMVSGTAALSSFAFGGSGISGNTAGNNGGGINIANDSIFSSTNFGNLIINGNNSDQRGGGIYLAQNGGVHIDGGSLSNNFSTNSSGGGIYSAGNNATIQLVSNRNIDMNINNNRATNGFGGAIRQSGGTLELGRNTAGTGKTTVSANTSSGGGALDISGVSMKIIGDIEFINNVSTNLGGAINTNSSTGRITNYTDVRPLFAGNTAAVGGALFFGNGGPYQLLGVEFGEDGNGNQAQNNGGAIYLSNVNNAELINLNINHNNANGIGGGLYIEGGNTLIDAYMNSYGYPGQFSDATIYGGACSTSSLMVGDYCSSFDSNSSSATGGAALVIGASADVTLKHTVIKNHISTAVIASDDGFLIANGTTTSHFDHNLFTANSGNSVLDFLTDNSDFNLSFNTFSGNTSTSTLTQQGLVNVNGAVNSSIFWGNSSGNTLNVCKRQPIYTLDI